MKKRYTKLASVALSAALLTGIYPLALAAQETPNTALWGSTAGFDVDSLTIQPGETTASINLNWYAPDGTSAAQIALGDGRVVEATVSELTTPTKVDESKYTDTGKMVCKATVSGLEPGTSYEYRISNDGGQTWSQVYTYTTPQAHNFTFAFTSDPQIKEDQSHNDDGWNSADGSNQTGWAKMMEVVGQAGATLMVSAGDQVEDQSWGKSSEYEAFFAPEEMTSIAYAPAVGNHDRHYMFADHFNLPNQMEVAQDGLLGSDTLLEQVKTTFRGQNSGTSQSHGNYIQATADEIANQSNSNGVTPNADGQYDFTERREMETKGNYYYLYNNVLFATLNTGAYPGGNDDLEGENGDNASGDSETPDSTPIDHFTVTKNTDGGAQTQGEENGASQLDVTKIAGYTSGQFNVDGGVMEIVSYNAATGWAYAVNGQSGLLTAIPLKTLEEKDTVDLLDGNDMDIKAMVEETDPTFAYGDMTSVAVSPDGSTLAAALQAAGYADAGRVALFTCNTDGSLTLDKLVEVGVQPDMVTFAEDNTVLSADEGEPRMGYTADATDPKGSVSVVDVTTGTAQIVTFDAFDAQRSQLTANHIILKQGSNPSTDLEPEYIAVSGGKAYVTLQEANAIAVLDLTTRTFTGIYSCGFEDYSVTPVDLDKGDEAYTPQTYENVLGIRMPDGIAAYEVDGVTYLVCANEGDSREWGDYLNENEAKKGAASPAGNIAEGEISGKVVYFGEESKTESAKGYDGLDSSKDYLFGGRSFTLYAVTEDGIQEVFTSGDDFESLTARYFPDYFNTSNDNAALDDRSGKKGPEAESVTVGVVDGKTYAFVALERTGGVMVYNVTDPSAVTYVNYVNSRDFGSIVPGSEVYEDGELDKWVTGGDVAPEGLAFLSAQQSPTGQPMLLAACEVSGTVAVYELTQQEIEKPTPSPEVSPSPEVTATPAPEPSANPEATQKPETDVPQTGDAAQLSLVLGVLVLSAAGLAAVVTLRKRRS